jgi:hypothetical protein
MLQPLIQPGVKMVVVNFPHNPTGTTIQQQDWQQLVAACKTAGAWLFSDEMYRFTGRRKIVLQRSCDRWCLRVKQLGPDCSLTLCKIDFPNSFQTCPDPILILPDLIMMRLSVYCFTGQLAHSGMGTP